MRSRMTLVAALGAVVALTAAGCGGGSQAGAGSALGGAAAIAPADSVALVAVDTDLGSGQWQAVNGLLAKFPAHDTLVTQLRQAFEKSSKLSWANDVKPALGAELDVVVLPAAAGGKAETVVLVQPGDQAEARRARREALRHGRDEDPLPVDRRLDGALGEPGRARRGRGCDLASRRRRRLPGGDRQARRRRRSSARTRTAPRRSSSSGRSARARPRRAKGTVVWGSADVVAASGGLKVDGYVRTQGATATEAPYSSALARQDPGRRALRRRLPGARGHRRDGDSRCRLLAAVAAAEPARAAREGRLVPRRRDRALREPGPADPVGDARDARGRSAGDRRRARPGARGPRLGRLRLELRLRLGRPRPRLDPLGDPPLARGGRRRSRRLHVAAGDRRLQGLRGRSSRATARSRRRSRRPRCRARRPGSCTRT